MEVETAWGWNNGSGLRTLAALAEEPSIVHSTHIGHPRLPVAPASGSEGTCVRMHISIRRYTQHIHVKEKSNLFKKFVILNLIEYIFSSRY